MQPVCDRPGWTRTPGRAPRGASAEAPRPLASVAAIESAGAVGLAADRAAAPRASSRGRGRRGRGDRGRLVGLRFKAAAPAPETSEAQGWHGIASSRALLAVRTALKRVMTWEQDRLDARRRGGVSPPG